MNLTHKLELTYIPSAYWNEQLSDFKLISNGKDLPKNTNFFLLWIPANNSEKKLNESINHTFPAIPVNKLLSCKINLAIPFPLSNDNVKKNSEKNFYTISSLSGKIMPISPAINLRIILIS